MEGEKNMLNQIVLVGRLVKDAEVKEEEGKKVAYITVAVPRSYKNEEGEYETDFVDCRLWNAIAENTSEYCKRGDLLGIKGRIQTKNIETEDGNKFKTTEVIAEKVTFLSSKKLDDTNE